MQTDGRTDELTGRNLNTRKIMLRLNVTFEGSTYRNNKELGKLLTKYICVLSLIQKTPLLSLYFINQLVFPIVDRFSVLYELNPFTKYI
jgi:hypothetical protein